MANHTLICWLFFAILLSAHAAEAKIALRAEETPQCAFGWIPSTETGSCYLITMYPERYSNANAVCASILAGATIVNIETQAEQTFLEGVLTESVWIGGNDIVTEGTFVWGDGKPFEFTSWASGEPSAYGFYLDEDCVEMSSGKGYKWNDEGCIASRKVLCEKVVIQPSTAAAQTEPPTTTTEATEPPTTTTEATEPPTTTTEATEPPTTTTEATEPPTTTTEPPTTTTEATEPPTTTTEATEPPTTTTQPPPVEVCPEKWLLNKSLKSCYHVGDTKLSWDNSKTYCAGLGGNLASIHSTEEQTFIQSRITENVFIGLNDKATENKFVWSDGSATNSFNWNGGQPDDGNSIFIAEDCVEMIKTTGKWNDVSCSSTLKPVCKKSSETLPRTTCPTGWKAANGRCFLIKSDQVTWNVAKSTCPMLNYGSQLCVPRNTVDNNFVHTLTQKKTWLGYSQADNKSPFVPVDNVPLTTTNWRAGEPNDYLGVDENCAEFLEDGQWNDEMCSMYRPYLCCVNEFQGRP